MIISYSITKEDLKSLWNNIRSHKWVIFLLGFVVGIVFDQFIIKDFNFKEKNLASLSNNLIIEGKTSFNASNNEICEEGIFKDNLENWIIPSSYDRVNEEGFYCPRNSSSFLSPDIWYKNLIPTNFKSLEIRYKLKNKNNGTSTVPSFIFSIGQNPRILRLYIPEKNNQIVGCEKNTATTSGFLFARERIYSLNEPIDWQEDVEIKIRLTINKSNEARIDANLIYLSALDKKSIEDYLNYDVILPDPKPESDLSKILIGFATFKGNCVKPISYKFCY